MIALDTPWAPMCRIKAWFVQGQDCVCFLWAVFRSAISSLTWDLQDDRPVCGDVNNFGQANPGSPTDYSMDQVQYSIAGQGFTPLL